MARTGGGSPARSGINRPRTGMMLAAFLLLACLLTPGAANAAPAVSQHSVTRDADAVAGSWSRQDLLSARPVPMPAPPGASFDIPAFDAGVSARSGPFYPRDVTRYPERLHGKVFFSQGLNRYQCSGTLVSSANRNVVYTAGHCVWDVLTKQWMQNFVFIPGYADGATPFNIYAATTLSTPSGYSRDGNLDYDVGLVTVDGDPETDLGGSRQIAFNLPQFDRDYTLYGYPADPDPPYDGERLAGCRSTAVLRGTSTPRTVGAAPCDMRKGASGGGWITDGNYLASLTSYTLCENRPDLCDVLWGPSFSKAARALYTSKAAGGGITPTIKLKFTPPKVVRKRSALFKFGGTASTPLRFRCRLDRKRFSDCGKRTVLRGLTAGRHVLRVRSTDQTGQPSRKTLKITFRVVLKNK
ncbi:MAG: trypsin-like serine peptidase [Solirubrobacterales bacterium]